MQPKRHPPISEAQLIEQALEAAGNRSPESCARLCEDLHLQFAYPGEFVAYLDGWKPATGRRTLVRRVIAHSNSLKEIQDALTTLSSKDRARVVVHYATDPYHEGLEVHYDLPGR